jgi:serine/threonine protein kinase
MIAVETDAGQLAAGRRDSPHTVWDQTTKQRSDTVMAFPTPLQATREASSGIYDMNVFGEDPLPTSGKHFWVVAFSGSGQSLKNNAFVGVVQKAYHTQMHKKASVFMTKERGVYGLRDDGDKDALRVNGNGKGSVGHDKNGRAFSSGDRIGVEANMDARPRSLTFYRNGEPIPRGVVEGFSDSVYIAVVVGTTQGRSSTTVTLEFPESVQDEEEREQVMALKAVEEHGTKAISTLVENDSFFQQFSKDKPEDAIDLQLSLHRHLDAMQEMYETRIQAALLSSFSYPQTKRIDLSKAGPIGESQLEYIGEHCPDLDAIFFQPNCPPSEPALLALKVACPKLRCVLLGREVSRQTFEQMLIQADAFEQLSKPIVLDLTGPDYAMLTDEGLLEIAALFPNIAQVFVDSNISVSGIEKLKATCPNAWCALLGREVTRTVFESMRADYAASMMLDMTNEGFGQLSDLGLSEIPALFPDLAAVFTRSEPETDFCTELSQAGLLKLQAGCRLLKCCLLGCEISVDQFACLQSCYATSKTLDLSNKFGQALSHDAAMELAEVFPEVEAIFSKGELSKGTLAALRGACPQLRCAILGVEILPTDYAKMVAELESDRTVNLTEPEFASLTDAGFAELAEVPGLCATMEALFLGPDSAVTSAALGNLRTGCHQGKCFELGREISKDTFLRTKAQVNDASASLDLSGADFERLTDAGMVELVQAFPDTDKLLVAADTIKQELRAKLVKAVTGLIRTNSSAYLTGLAAPIQLPLGPGLTMGEEDQESAFTIVGQLFVELEARQAGRWKLQELIGCGGSGLVILARDKQLGAVAVKVITPQGPVFTEKDASRLEREVTAMKRAQHDNVCACHEWFISANKSMCVMLLEHLNGPSLKDMMQSRHGDPMPEVEVLRIAMGCLGGLKQVHSCGLIHRDIKPENIMAHELADGGIVYKIIDFGIAMADGSDGETTVATVMKTSGVRGVGTLHFMSPEQHAGDEVDARTDLYSLSVTLYYLLCGKLPFGDGETKRQRVFNAICGASEATDLRDVMGLQTVSDREVSRIGDKVAEAMAKGLFKDADERFQTAVEMLDVLEKAMIRRGYTLYDCMISYRVQSEAKFALALFERLSREQIEVPGSSSRRMRVCKSMQLNGHFSCCDPLVQFCFLTE